MALKLEGAERSIDVMECGDPFAAASLDIGAADEPHTSHPIPIHTISSSSDDDDDDDDVDDKVMEEVNCSLSCNTQSSQFVSMEVEREEKEEEECGARRQEGGIAVSSWPASLKENHCDLESRPTVKSSANRPGNIII